jgi:nitrate reductase gamma subunit
MIRSWLRYFWFLLKLRSSPEHAPASQSVFVITVLAYFSLATLFTAYSQSLALSMFLALVECGLLYFLTKIALWIRNYPERSTQTLTALFGAGAFILFFAVILLGILKTSVDSQFHAAFAVGLLTLFWNITVFANILRHALSLPYIAGLGIALIYVYMSFTITLRFLKVMSLSQV